MWGMPSQPLAGVFGSNAMSDFRHFRGSRFTAHSQYRMTVNPADLSSRFTRRSLILLRANLALQYLMLVLGKCPHLGQPCQKHPSTKRAIFAAGKTKSGHPGKPDRRMRQPRIPSWERWARILRSVVAFCVDFIARIFALREAGVKLKSALKDMRFNRLD